MTNVRECNPSSVWVGMHLVDDWLELWRLPSASPPHTADALLPRPAYPIRPLIVAARRLVGVNKAGRIYCPACFYIREPMPRCGWALRPFSCDPFRIPHWACGHSG